MNGNNTGWTVTFSFTATQDITISSLDLGFQFVTGTGTRHDNADSKAGDRHRYPQPSGDLSSTADLSFERVQADKDGTPTADVQEASFNTPLTVKAGETFTLTVNAKAPETGGTFLGLSRTGASRGPCTRTGNRFSGATSRLARAPDAPPQGIILFPFIFIKNRAVTLISGNGPVFSLKKSGQLPEMLFAELPSRCGLTRAPQSLQKVPPIGKSMLPTVGRPAGNAWSIPSRHPCPRLFPAVPDGS